MDRPPPADRGGPAVGVVSIDGPAADIDPAVAAGSRSAVTATEGRSVRGAARWAWGWFVGLTLLAAVVDLATKRYLFDLLGMPGTSPPIVLVPGMLALETNLNEGALFGMGQGMGALFAGVSGVAIAGILWLVSRADTRSDPWLLTALGLITGGIIGNLWDRLGIPRLAWHAPLERIGQPVLAVRDWIHFRLEGVIDWPIFNLADSWLVIGAGMLLLATWRASAVPAGQGATPDD